MDTLSHFPTRLCGRIALVSRFSPQISLQILEHGSHTREDWCAEAHLAMDRFFPGFFEVWCAFLETHGALWSLRRVSFLEKVFFLTKLLRFLQQPANPFHNFSPACSWLTVGLFVPEYALFTKFASRFCFACLTYGRMPKTT